MANRYDYVTNNLVEFETVFDCDLAICLTLLSKLKNTKMLNENLRYGSTNLSANKLRNLLLFREDTNPLSAILDKSLKDSFDVLLVETKLKYEEEIYKAIKPTDLLQPIVNLGISKGSIQSVVNCRTEKEVEFVKSFTGSIEPVLNCKDISPYTGVFIKYIDDITAYSPLGGKYIYITNAQYNLGPEFLPKPVALTLGSKNIIRLVDIYKNITIPRANAEELLNEYSNNVKNKSSIKYSTETSTEGSTVGDDGENS